MKLGDLKNAAVEWLIDCSHEIEEQDAIELIFNMTEERLRKYLDRVYSSGFDGFVQDYKDSL